MGVRTTSVATTTLLGALPASGAETVILTTPPISQPLDNAAVLLFFYYIFLVGATTTSVTVNIKRGTSTAGAVVNVGSPISVTAGNNALLSGCYQDLPGAVAGQQYSLTLSGTGTTGAATNREGCMLALVL